MTDIYEARVIELAAETEYLLKDPIGAVLPKEIRYKFDLMKELAAECKIASYIREKKIEFSTNLISWIKEEFFERYINRIDIAVNRQYPEKTFFNIVYCVIERLGIWIKREQRDRVISFSKYCELIGKNRKTLSQECRYNEDCIKNIWIDKDIKANPDLRRIIIDIFNDIVRKVDRK